jgi:hypothetical protein
MTAQLRRVDVSHMTPAQPPEQTPPIFGWVPIDQLRIDDRYQRPLDKRSWTAITRMAAQFNWDAFAAITVAPLEGDLFAIIDGQHRAHAALLAGKHTVPCMITRISAAEQARAFAQVNSAIPISAHSRFKADLEARDPEALAVAKACADAGCRAMTAKWNASDKRPRDVFCIGALRRMVRAAQADHLTAVLRAIQIHDGDSVAMYHDAMLTPLVGAAAKCRCTDAAAIALAMSRRSPWKVLESAEDRARTHRLPFGAARIDAFAAMIAAAMLDRAQTQGAA